MNDYATSKTLAEKAAWEYQANNNNPFEIVTICPTLLLGPGIGSRNVVSEEFVTAILTDSKPIIKCASNYYADVRDVARAHLLAIKVQDAKNRRFMVHGEEKNKHEITEFLTKKFGDKGFKPGCEQLNDDLVGPYTNNNAASREILGVKYRPLEETLTDMVEDMLAAGRVKPEAKSWWSSLFG